MEPDVQSLETSEIVLVFDDQSENHSSTSDIIHLDDSRVESDEEEDADLQSSVLSMLGSDKELAEMRAEIGALLDIRPLAEPDLKPPKAVELLMCVEDPAVEEIEPEDASQSPFTHTPLMSEPLDFTLASVPISDIISQVLEHLPSPEELPQTSSSTLTEPSESESTNTPTMSQGQTTTPDSSPFELPVFLVGGAALVAILGVLTYTLGRK